MRILPPCSALKAEPARKPDPEYPQCGTAALSGGRFLLFALAFAGFFFSQPLAIAEGSPSGDTRKRDAALTGTLLEGARNALSLGYLREAVELTNEALEYSPANSDALYFRALCGLSLKEPFAQIGFLLENALSTNQFFYYSREDALVLYCSYLVRVRNYDDALRLLSGLRHSAVRDALEAEALRLSGNPEKARQALLSLIGRYPSEAARCLPWLLSLDQETRSALDAQLVSELFRLLPGIKERSLEFLAALAPFAATLEDSRLLLREFRAMGGKSANATIASLKWGLITDNDAIAELFSGAYPLFSVVVRELFDNLGSEQSRQSFLQAFLSFSGSIASDENHDGLADFSITYEMGQAQSAILDENQDDRAEGRLLFADGVPLSGSLLSPSLDVEFKYGIWPYIDAVSYTDASAQKNYSVKPASLAYRIIDMTILGRWKGRPAILYEHAAIPPLLEQQALANAVHVDEKKAGKRQSVDLAEGLPVQSWYSLQSGLSATVVYANGMAHYEQLDLNNDGRYEGRKTWVLDSSGESIPRIIEIDANADGIYEYSESLAAPFEKNWDLDDNGSMDLRLIPENAQRLRYEFSSRLDGNRDIVLVYSEGKIIQAFRNGKELFLIPDSGGNILWLGRKPFDFGTQIPIPGWGVRASARYFVLSVAGVLYAEILE